MFWPTNKDYLMNKKIISQLKCVNDTAERGVALAQSYNNKLTTNENNQQQVFQVVENHRNNFKNHNKCTLVYGLTKKN